MAAPAARVRLRAEERPSRPEALAHAEGLDRARLSKLQPHLPPRLEADVLSEVLTEI